MQRFLVNHRTSLFSRVMNKMGHGPKWFRPAKNGSAGDLTRVFDAARALGLPCIEMMFHSSELMPGCSPNFLDEDAIETLYGVLEETFSYMKGHGVQGVTLSAFAARYAQGQSRHRLILKS